MVEVKVPMVKLRVPSVRQVRAVRAWFGMTQTEFAKKANVSLSTIQDYELTRRAVSENTLQILALAMRKIGVKFDRNGTVHLPE